jgi:hypothetical protein
MTMKHKRYVRRGLLELIENDHEDILDFTARFLANKNENWITISQLCLKGSKNVLASHLNLPVHKLKITERESTGWKKGQLLSIKATVSTYVSQGVVRGTLVGYGENGLIEIASMP